MDWLVLVCPIPLQATHYLDACRRAERDQKARRPDQCCGLRLITAAGVKLGVGIPINHIVRFGTAE